MNWLVELLGLIRDLAFGALWLALLLAVLVWVCLGAGNLAARLAARQHRGRDQED